MMIYDVEVLKRKAKEIRIDVIKSLAEAGSGHTGASLGLADIFTVLYFNILRHKPDKPDWEERDRLILSIGHAAPVLYATLAHVGYFPKEELLTLRKLGSRLQGHPGKDFGLPGLEISSGSLGQGLSVATGIALVGKMDNRQWRVFCVHGDGELQEGSVWEAMMSAAHYKLDNLILIIDRNFCQIDGKTSEVMEIEPLRQKLEAFGWNVFECDGNNIEAILDIFKDINQSKGKPKALIAKTLMGKGVPQIEDDYTWHGKAPTKEQAEIFIKELLNNS